LVGIYSPPLTLRDFEFVKREIVSSFDTARPEGFLKKIVSKGFLSGLRMSEVA
jgi:hypothetical protein